MQRGPELREPAQCGPELRGRDLRYLLTLVLHESRHPMTVAQLVEAAEVSGRSIAGRASKSVSDALRWEIARRRVIRVGRSLYAAGTLPRSTEWWIRKQVRDRLA